MPNIQRGLHKSPDMITDPVPIGVGCFAFYDIGFLDDTGAIGPGPVKYFADTRQSRTGLAQQAPILPSVPFRRVEDLVEHFDRRSGMGVGYGILRPLQSGNTGHIADE